jgi:hypothetical protein
MNKLYAVALLAVTVAAPGFAGTNPPIPAPEPNFTEPGTPDARRAYKIAVLENEIAQDQYVISNPGGGKVKDVEERVKVAKHNLKINEEVLAKVKAGTDMEVYFCSLCGREMMKNTDCPHCKAMKELHKTVPLFEKGIHRPSAALENS